MNEIVLEGCKPKPLGSYLKALGILRLVAEQKDSEARGYWNKNDDFVLVTKLSETELFDFFLNTYNPSPICDPWNGGSGFFKRENKKTGLRTNSTKATNALDAIIYSKAERLKSLRELLTMTKHILEGLNYITSPGGTEKDDLLSSLRASLPDEALDWLDASTVLGNKASYPALLGTGGNDGNLDFVSTFFQRLLEVFSFEDGASTPMSQFWLENALYAKTVVGLVDSSYGQFNPVSSGGYNTDSSTGKKAKAVVNPWDYLLTIEGALVFASAAVRRLDSEGISTVSSPFAVRPNRAAYSGKSESEKIRAEIWFPLWRTSSSYSEIYHLFAEGRATVKRRKSKDSLDIAMAVATMGVDRGISEFERYSFIERNGNNYYATPLGRFQVKYNPTADILEELHGWLRHFRNGPSSVNSAAANLENQMIQFCRTGDDAGLYELLVSAGIAERALVNSSYWAKQDSYCKPLLLEDKRWILNTYDGSAEFRLAAALAACSVKGIGGIRQFFEPIQLFGKYPKFSKETRMYTKHNELFVKSVSSIMKKILLSTTQKGYKYYPVISKISASTEDISAFISGELSDTKLMQLVNALLLFDWYSFKKEELPWAISNKAIIPGVWATLKLAMNPYELIDKKIPLDTSIFNSAISGNLNKATGKAARRLLGSGFPSAIKSAAGSSQLSKRMAAALLFPLSYSATYNLFNMVTNKEEIMKGTNNENNQ